MQRLWKFMAIVPLGASVLMGNELGGACVFKPRPVTASHAPAAPPRAAVVEAWEPKVEENGHHQPPRQPQTKVQLVADRKAEPGHAAPAPAHTPEPVLNPAPVKSPLLRNVLTNEGVAMMAQAGYTERFIIEMIHRKQTRFDVSPAGLSWLAEMGLTERIVRTMVANERKEDDSTMVPAYLSLTPADDSNGRGEKTGRAKGRSSRQAVPVTVQTPRDYWYPPER
ncbi:MAG: hypothetical protein SFV51_07405 [Bryobacteraceae bacterium]|nr:hypothetical protein [Bryobacteraceae bacterium]